MEDIERIKERLENIQSVEPIITSLRTIAAGGWQLALRRVRASERYMKNLSEVLATLLRYLSPARLDPVLVSRNGAPPRKAMMVVIASERGLCGSFNEMVLSGAEHLIAQQQLRSEQILVTTLGSRAEVHFRTRNRDLFMTYPLPVTRVPSFEFVCDMGQTLLAPLYSNEIDAIYVVYSPYKATLTLPPISSRWLPIDVGMLPGKSGGWLQPIIETDKEVLFERAIEEWIFVRLFQLVMESVASEQAARFRAMDAASSNLERIIGELTLSYHTARQHAITMEMLDLVSGAGILRGPRGRQKKRAK